MSQPISLVNVYTKAVVESVSDSRLPDTSNVSQDIINSAQWYGNSSSLLSIQVDKKGRVLSSATYPMNASGLAPSGVTAGSYGSSSNIPIISVDTFGIVTSASNIGISIPPPSGFTVSGSNVSTSSNLIVSGVTTLSSNLNVSSNASVRTLTVTGVATLCNNLTVLSNATVTGSLTTVSTVNLGTGGNHVGIGTFNTYPLHVTTPYLNTNTNNTQIAIGHRSLNNGTSPILLEQASTGQAWITNYGSGSFTVQSATSNLILTSAANLVLTNGGIQTMTLSNGNVGVGVANPSSKLAVNGGVTVGTGYGSATSPGNGLAVQGFVGIGTTSPVAPLHVQGNMYTSNGFLYVNYSPNDNRSSLIVTHRLADSNGVSYPLTIQQDLNGVCYMQNNKPNCNLQYYTSGTTSRHAFIIGSNNAFDVVGGSAIIYGNGNTTYPGVGLLSIIAAGNGYGVRLWHKQDYHGYLENGTTDCNLYYQVAGTGFHQFTGSVGIGINPSTALDVNGSTRLRGSLNTSSTTSLGTSGSNVGIGTLTAYPFHVTTPLNNINTNNTQIAIGHRSLNNGTTPLLLEQANTGEAWITNYGTGSLTVQTPNQHLILTAGGLGCNIIFNNGGTRTMSLSNGSVGIGVTNPVTQFDITGDAAIRGNIRLGHVASSSSRVSVNGGVSIGNAYITNTAPTNGLIVQGNVGINTTSPDERVHIFGRSKYSYDSTSAYFLEVDAYRALRIANSSIGRTGGENSIKIAGDVTNIYGIRYGASLDLENTGQQTGGSSVWQIRGPTLCNGIYPDLSGRLEFNYSIYTQMTLDPNTQILKTRAFALASDPGSSNEIVKSSDDSTIGNAVIPWYGFGLSTTNVVNISGWYGINFRTGSAYSRASVMFLNGNGDLGLGLVNTQPTFQLALSRDSAAKPSTTTWTVSSDSRIKNNITSANIDRCYEIVKQLDLKYYEYNQDYLDSNAASDRRKLGWIAQEVEPIFPKAVVTSSNYGFDDFKSLNADQIYAAMYGCIKKMQVVQEDLQAEVAALREELRALKA